MKKNKSLNLIYISLILGFIILSCSKNNVVSDADKTAALRNVTITYDSVVFQLQLPAGALSGQSYAQLAKQDSATYTNPANYFIIILENYTANNKKSNAQEAKFDGMTINIVMDTILSSPIKAFCDSFVVKKNTSLPVHLNTTINLAKQRRAGIYILQQFVHGHDVVTTQTPYLNYKIGLLQGTIELPSFKENIPTRASNITKAFLSGLLDSGTFN